MIQERKLVKIDLKDRRILHQLDIDARQSYAQIGKKIRLSKSVVEYRINRLKERGIIRGFYTLINTSRFGLINFRLFIRFRNTTSEIEEQIISYLQEDDRVAWMVRCDGNWDISFRIETKDVYGFGDWTEKLHSKFSQHIDEERVFIFTYSEIWNKEYLLEKDIREDVVVQRHIIRPSENSLEENDLAILEMLSKDCRIPLVKIAEKTGLSTKTISKRIRMYLDEEYISSFRVLINYFLLGYEYYQVLFNLMSPSPQEKDELLTYLKRDPGITFYEEVIGGADFEIELQVKDAAHFRTILKGIKERFGRLIKNHEYLSYYKEYPVPAFRKEHLE